MAEIPGTRARADNSRTDRAAVAFEVRSDVVNRIVYVRGEVDVATAPEVLAAARALVRAGDGDITLDLEGATFIDAIGLGAVVGCHNLFLSRGRRLSVVNLSDRLNRVFVLGGLRDLITAA